MIKVIVEFNIIPEKKEEFISKAGELIEKSRNESGNISYNLYFNKNNDTGVFIEEWVSEDALEEHKNTEHFKNIAPELEKLQLNTTFKIFNPYKDYDTDNILFKRRSIRSFIKDKKVENEKINMILHAGMQAPSSCNKQPWEFMVIDDNKIIDELALIDRHFELAKKAPLVIIPMGNKATSYKGADGQLWYPLDVSACIENILLEVTALGLGAVWIGCYPDELRINGIKKLFNLPEHLVPFAVLAVGYSAEANYYKNRYDNNKIHFNKYNS